MLTDPIADMLTRLRNASAVKKTSLTLPHSKEKEAILKVLADNGYIKSYKTTTPEGTYKTLEITLQENKPLFPRRISRPGRRIYLKHQEISTIKNGLGMQIISTSQGVLAGKEAAKNSTGGELICEIE